MYLVVCRYLRFLRNFNIQQNQLRNSQICQKDDYPAITFCKIFEVLQNFEKMKILFRECCTFCKIYCLLCNLTTFHEFFEKCLPQFVFRTSFNAMRARKIKSKTFMQTFEKSKKSTFRGSSILKISSLICFRVEKCDSG